MKILLVYDEGFLIGGVKTYSDFVHHAFKKRGHDVCFFCFNSNNVNQSLVIENIKILISLKRKIKNFNPDVVYIHNIRRFHNSVYLACLGRNTVRRFPDYQSLLSLNYDELSFRYDGVLDELDQKVVRFLYFRNKSHFLLRWLEKLLLKNVKIISPSLEYGDLINKIGLKSFYLPNTTSNIKRDSLINLDKKRRLIYVGRLHGDKGVDVAIRCLRHLSGDFSLTIIGDGPDKQYLKELSSKLPVKFIGRVDKQDVGFYYCQNDIVIVPSIIPEMSPWVIFEAMSYGLPIVGSDISGIREILQGTDNKPGIVFKVGDPVDLASKIIDLADNPKFYNFTVKQIEQASNKYNQIYYFDKLEEIYKT